MNTPNLGALVDAALAERLEGLTARQKQMLNYQTALRTVRENTPELSTGFERLIFDSLNSASITKLSDLRDAGKFVVTIDIVEREFASHKALCEYYGLTNQTLYQWLRNQEANRSSATIQDWVDMQERKKNTREYHAAETTTAV